MVKFFVGKKERNDTLVPLWLVIGLGVVIAVFWGLFLVSGLLHRGIYRDPMPASYFVEGKDDVRSTMPQ